MLLLVAVSITAVKSQLRQVSVADKQSYSVKLSLCLRASKLKVSKP